MPMPKGKNPDSIILEHTQTDELLGPIGAPLLQIGATCSICGVKLEITELAPAPSSSADGPRLLIQVSLLPHTCSKQPSTSKPSSSPHGGGNPTTIDEQRPSKGATSEKKQPGK